MEEQYYPTCEERIEGNLKGRMDDLRRFLSGGGEFELTCRECEHVWCTDDEVEECPECGEEEKITVDTNLENGPFNEYGLSLLKKWVVYRYELSTGGPADGFWIYLDPDDGEIVRISYYFQDWWDGAERDLTGSDFDTAKELFQNEFFFDAA